MISGHTFVDRLLTLNDLPGQRRFLVEHFATLGTDALNEAANFLKEKVIEFLRTDSRAAADCADLVIYLGELTEKITYQALGLRLKAMVLSLAQGNYVEALSLYDQALIHYQALDDKVNAAHVHVTRIWAATHTGEPYARLLADAFAAGEVLEANRKWSDLATLHNNLGIVQRHFGRFSESLDSFLKARMAYTSLGEAGAPFLANNANNLAFTLYTLGQFKASIEAGEQALEMATQRQQSIPLARAHHNLGLTYYGLGHYNRALQLFEQATKVWLAQQRYHEVAQTELTATYCLLELRRFYDVLDKCAYVRDLITQRQVRPETLFSLLNEAKAYGMLGQYDQALATLASTRRIIAEHSSPWDLAQADLAEATLLYLQGLYSQAYPLAQAAAKEFYGLSSPVEMGQAYLLAARVAVRQGKYTRAEEDIHQALLMATIPSLQYETHFVLGQLEQARGNDTLAFRYYQEALTAVEQMQKQTMLEYRADFLADADKESLYQELISLSLAFAQPEQALSFVERMKSRALMDLLTYRLDLRVQTRTKDDSPLVDRFNRLRRERDELHRRLEHEPDLPTETRQELSNKQLGHEKEMTGIRHQLLIRHASYAYDLALTPIPAIPLPYSWLDTETLLLEYSLVHGQWVVFLVSADHRTLCRQLLVTAKQTNYLLTSLQLNLELAGCTPPNQIKHLLPNAQGLLKQLYDYLIAPITNDLAAYQRLIIVPHGHLHYIPFHALYDGQHHLIETHAVSYLPAASFLHHSRQIQPTGDGLLAIGYSDAQRIPHTLDEARSVAALWEQRHILLEEQATLAHIQALVPQFRILHFATHGEFRADNPLFSGLALADGWLTTLDIFNLQLNASLVTLSACYTGRHVIGGGDELLGLARAFLSSGTSTVLLTHWAVADAATVEVMSRFYQYLRGGMPKDRALQAAQCWLLNRDQNANGPSPYAHLYFWAPFYLIGEANYI